MLESPLERIINGDCLMELNKLADASIDMIITDVPFNSEKKMGKPFRDESDLKMSEREWFIYDKMSSRSYLFWLSNIFSEYYRVLKDGSHVYIFANWKSLRNLMDALESALFTINNLITWDKEQFGVGYNYRPQTEFVIFASKGKNRELNNKSTPNIVRIKRVKNADMYVQVQKPVEVIEWILEAAARKDDVILDSFLGTGSTALACKRRGYSFIGVDVDSERCDITRKRLQEITLPLVTETETIQKQGQ